MLVVVRSNNKKGEHNRHTHTSAEEGNGRYITSVVTEKQMELATHKYNDKHTGTSSFYLAVMKYHI